MIISHRFITIMFVLPDLLPYLELVFNLFYLFCGQNAACIETGTDKIDEVEEPKYKNSDNNRDEISEGPVKQVTIILHLVKIFFNL